MSGRNQAKNRATDEGIGETTLLLTSPAGGVLQQTTPMAYAMQTKTCRRKSMSPKQFRLWLTPPAKPPIEDALQNLGSKTGILTNTNTGSDEG